jgi:ADP-ribosylglycohydrolase
VVEMRVKDLEQIVRDEIVQRKEEGYDIADAEERFTRTKEKSISELKEILRILENSAFRSDFPYREPSNLEEIRAERPEEPKRFRVDLSEDELYDKIYGGWLGRCAGCLLGKPVEGLSKEHIEEWLRAANAYPLKQYFPPLIDLPSDAPEWLRKRAEWAERLKLLHNRIDHMVRDDDIDYTIIGLHILEKYGLNFTTMNVGETWLSLLPYMQVYTAERAAYRNLVDGLEPPETATYMNPYREWIGAQIRADIWGYVAPGNPDLAAELAYRDASLSHVKNGIYGEMFVSAMLSAAFVTDNIEEIISTGLSVIPRKCRLAEAINDVLRWSGQLGNWKDALNRIYGKYRSYHPVHTINNAAIVAMGLLYGEGDYERSITIAVMGGLDTDCNGATVGSIIGVMLGAKALPEKWIKPLNDTIESYVIGYNNSRISELAERTLKIAGKTLRL